MEENSVMFFPLSAATYLLLVCSLKGLWQAEQRYSEPWLAYLADLRAGEDEASYYAPSV